MRVEDLDRIQMYEGKTISIDSILHLVKRRKRQLGLLFSSRKQILRSQIKKKGIERAINPKKYKNLANDCNSSDIVVRLEEDSTNQGENIPLSGIALQNIEEVDFQGLGNAELKGIYISGNFVF